MSDRDGGASVRFAETKTKTTTDFLSGDKGQKHEGIAHEIGEALTKGSGPNGYLAVSTAAQETVVHFWQKLT